MTTDKKPSPAKSSPRKTTRNGRRIVAGLRAVVTTLESGGMDAVKATFTTSTPLPKPDPPTASVTEVAGIRRAVGATPAAFAALIGVTRDQIATWERGKGELSNVEARFLAEIRRDPAYWKRRLADARTPSAAPA